MTTLLHLVSYVAAVAAFVFVTLSLASGLLWLAEVIEEHSRIAKIVGQRMCYAVIAFHVLLCLVDPNMPPLHIIFSIACHLVYLSNFQSSFPLVSLTSWSFIASCLLVVADHFLWFFHFHNVTQEARNRERRWRHPMQPMPHVPTFLDIATFFGICVWLLPLFLFLALSANDNALPTASRHDHNTTLMPAFEGSQPRPTKQRSSLFVTLSTKAMSFIPSRALIRGRSRKNSDGLIAPRSISRPPSPLNQGSSLLSPSFQRRSTSPASSMGGALMPPASPFHSPVASPTSSTFDTGSWIPVDNRSDTGTTIGSGDENVARRRVNVIPPPKRAASYT